jgi:hypothetical protein
VPAGDQLVLAAPAAAVRPAKVRCEPPFRARTCEQSIDASSIPSRPAVRSSANHRSTRFSQDALVGVKSRWSRG